MPQGNVVAVTTTASVLFFIFYVFAFSSSLSVLFRGVFFFFRLSMLFFLIRLFLILSSFFRATCPLPSTPPSRPPFLSPLLIILRGSLPLQFMLQI